MRRAFQFGVAHASDYAFLDNGAVLGGKLQRDHDPRFVTFGNL